MAERERLICQEGEFFDDSRLYLIAPPMARSTTPQAGNASADAAPGAV